MQREGHEKGYKQVFFIKTYLFENKTNFIWETGESGDIHMWRNKFFQIKRMNYIEKII